MGKVKAVAKKAVVEEDTNPLLVARPKNFSVGNDIPPKRDVSRFVRWPKYVTRQRQKRVLERRLKVLFALGSGGAVCGSTPRCCDYPVL